MRVRNLSITHEVYTTGLCFSVEPFCVVWLNVEVLQHLFPCLHLEHQEQKAMFKQYGFNLQKSGSKKTPYLMIRSAFARSHVTFWLFVAVCADASLPQVDFPWTGFLGMHNAVIQIAPMHSASLL